MALYGRVSHAYRVRARIFYAEALRVYSCILRVAVVAAAVVLANVDVLTLLLEIVILMM